MKNTFTKFSISILSILGLISVLLLIIPIITKSDDILMARFAMICMFIFGIYYYYLKNKRFVNKDSRIFPLFNRKFVNIFSLGLNIILVGVIVFAYFKKGSNFGFFAGFSVVFFNSLIWTLFPYRSGNFIMMDNEGIYAPKIGFLKWDLISSFNIMTDLMLVDIELKDNEKKQISYNKYVDIEVIKAELQRRII